MSIITTKLNPSNWSTSFNQPVTRFCAVLLFVALSGLNSSYAQVDSDVLFTPEHVETSLSDTLRALNDNYVYPEKAREIESEMLRRLNAGAYQDITTRSEFVAVISSDLREISGDGHLSIHPASAQNATPTHVGTETIDRFKFNFAFESIEVLPDNIGYLKFNKFYGDDDARMTAESAFSFLQNTEAMVIDLSENKGGSPDLVQYLLSYFIGKDTLLWSIVDRYGEEVFQASVLDDVLHTKFKQDYPLLIITTEQTASAAEFFAYTLKHFGKAEIVGQNSMGIAHLVGAGRINEFLNWRFSLSRPVNPVTGTSWEGVGVIPDVVVPEHALLEEAHKRAAELAR